MKKANVILVGAGWSSCLLAWRLMQKRPELKVVLFESQKQWETNRTWSFHRSDLGGAYWLLPLVSHVWDAYDVSFPGVQRRISQAYCSIRGDVAAKAILSALGPHIHFGAQVSTIAHDHVVLSDGTVWQADVVFDGRGSFEARTRLGYQKFVGLEVELGDDHGLARPILMDARVPQIDGFRFFYVLPWSARSILIEDTRYSVSPELNESQIESQIFSYAQIRGWKITRVTRKELGVLPLPLDTMDDDSDDSVLRLGMSGGYFHPVTGYSTADAVRVADLVSDLRDLDARTAIRALRDHRHDLRAQNRFFHFLNRMMFLAAPDQTRVRIFERFYQLNDGLISRFYAGRLKKRDQARLLIGKPPVSIGPALRCLRG